MKEELQKAGKSDRQSILDIENVSNDPLKQFKRWFKKYQESGVKDFNAMVLSTVYKNKPSSRVVLLKGIDKGGFEFYTNYQSRKGKQIELNPYGCLNFFWPQLEQQVRIEGRVGKLSAVESNRYFSSRPQGSKIGAWVSPQSSEIKSRNELEENVKKYINHFQGKIPRPENWGGYRVVPLYFEFWQCRNNRLHDRICYKWISNKWQLKRLAP